LFFDAAISGIGLQGLAGLVRALGNIARVVAALKKLGWSEEATNS